MKKTMFSILSIIIIFSFSIIDIKSKYEENNLEVIQKEQAKIIFEFDKILEKYKGVKEFDDLYGGAYFIGKDLNINIADNNMQYFISKFPIKLSVTYHLVSTSLKQLTHIKELIIANTGRTEMISVSINVKNNSVLVNKSFNKTFIPLNLNSSFIEIDNNLNEYTLNSSKSIINGDKYKIKSNYCSFGYAAKNNDGDIGIVTAGHCVTETGAGSGTNIYYNGDHAGDIDNNWSFSNGVSADAAFIIPRDPFLSSPWVATHKLVFNDKYYSTSNNSSLLLPGTIVSFYGTFDDGSTNNSIEYGTIIDTSSSRTYHNTSAGSVTVYDMIRTDIITHPGDSGAPLIATYYGYNGSSLYLYKMVIGINSGGNSSDSLFSKVENIENTINVTTY